MCVLSRCRRAGVVLFQCLISGAIFSSQGPAARIVAWTGRRRTCSSVPETSEGTRDAEGGDGDWGHGRRCGCRCGCRHDLGSHRGADGRISASSPGPPGDPGRHRNLGALTSHLGADAGRGDRSVREASPPRSDGQRSRGWAGSHVLPAECRSGDVSGRAGSHVRALAVVIRLRAFAYGSRWGPRSGRRYD